MTKRMPVPADPAKPEAAAKTTKALHARTDDIKARHARNQVKLTAQMAGHKTQLTQLTAQVEEAWGQLRRVLDELMRHPNAGESTLKRRAK